MDDETKSKLEEVLQRKAQNEDAFAAKRRVDEAAALESGRRREEARQRWQRSIEEIQAAIAAVNPRLKPACMGFAQSEKPKKADDRGLAQLFIRLLDENDLRDRQIVLNVNDFGLVQVVTLIPHTGGKIPDFKIEDADQAYYERLMVEFLDMCIAKPKPAGPKG